MLIHVLLIRRMHIRCRLGNACSFVICLPMRVAIDHHHIFERGSAFSSWRVEWVSEMGQSCTNSSRSSALQLGDGVARMCEKSCGKKGRLVWSLMTRRSWTVASCGNVWHFRRLNVWERMNLQFYRVCSEPHMVTVLDDRIWCDIKVGIYGRRIMHPELRVVSTVEL